jgi:hypothetical protein
MLPRFNAVVAHIVTQGFLNPRRTFVDIITGMQTPFNISIYPGAGTADGVNGDHILLAPAYNVTSEDVRMIVDTTVSVIEAFFNASIGVDGI